jgi:hypothetical protein
VSWLPTFALLKDSKRNEMKKVNSVLVKGTIALTLIGVVSTPVKAATLANQSSNPLMQVIEQFNQQLSSIGDYLNKVVAAQIKPLSDSLGKDLEAALGDVTGALGLPDPIKSRSDVEKVASATDTPVNQSEQATNEVDRQITRAAVNSTLGKEGQQQIKEQVEQTQNSVGLVQQQAQVAQQAVSTQDVLKQIAEQNAQTGTILGSLRADSLQAAQRQDLTNLNLTNISRSLDGQNQAQQSELIGAGFDTFRTASRARLF